MRHEHCLLVRHQARAGGKLPVGVQIIGPQYADCRTIAVAGLIERDYFGVTPPPDFA